MVSSWKEMEETNVEGNMFFVLEGKKREILEEWIELDLRMWNCGQIRR